MWRGRNFLPRAALIKICFAHIYAHLKYLLPIWAVGPKYKIYELKLLQNKALRIIFNKSPLTETDTLYNHQFVPIESLIKLDQILLIFKIQNDLMRHNIVLINNRELHRYNNRNNFIHKSANRSSFGLNSILSTSIKAFNELPDALKLNTSIVSFKKELRQYLCNI